MSEGCSLSISRALATSPSSVLALKRRTLAMRPVGPEQAEAVRRHRSSPDAARKVGSEGSSPLWLDEPLPVDVAQNCEASLAELPLPNCGLILLQRRYSAPSATDDGFMRGDMTIAYIWFVMCSPSSGHHWISGALRQGSCTWMIKKELRSPRMHHHFPALAELGIAFSFHQGC